MKHNSLERREEQMMMEEKFAHKVQQALVDPPLIRAAAPPLRQFQRGHGQHERQRIFSD